MQITAVFPSCLGDSNIGLTSRYLRNAEKPSFFFRQEITICQDPVCPKDGGVPELRLEYLIPSFSADGIRFDNQSTPGSGGVWTLRAASE